MLIRKSGRAAEALAMEAGAAAIRGPEHRYNAEVTFSLALLAQQTGDLGEAERLHKQALKITERALGLEHEVAASLEAYAALLRQMGRTSEAESLEARARQIRDQPGQK